MTNEELMQKIKAEIERLRGIGGIVPLDNREQKTGYESALIDVEIFLDSLEPEKPMNQEGLEAEIQRVVENYNKLVYGTKVMKPSGIEKIARHFAKWGTEQFAKIVRGNLSEIGNNAQSQFEQLYFEITGTKMYGGYND